MASHDLSATNFGLLIAYVIPGFLALNGLPGLSGSIGTWGIANPEMTVAGFLSETVEAVFAGLTVSSVRWLVLDTIHHRTGIKPPLWNFAALERSTPAFDLLIQIHYRYYKFYGNSVVALLWAFATSGYALGWKGLLYWILASLFFLGSRDSLHKYYERAGHLLADKRQV
jgi:hypothetical protein